MHRKVLGDDTGRTMSNALRKSAYLLKLAQCQSPPQISTDAKFSLVGDLCRRFFSALPSQTQYSVVQSSGAGGPVIRKPVYAVLEVGALQYKVSPGDLIYAERLRGVDVGAELSFSSVQAAGTCEQTLVGRPYVDGASVTAVIEEQVQDAKVVSFKKRRRKNSRRIKGHRQMLTGLRITAVHGIDIPKEGEAQVYTGHIQAPHLRDQKVQALPLRDARKKPQAVRQSQRSL